MARHWPPPIPYFPEPYPEESVYSLLARCSRHLGSPNFTPLAARMFGVRLEQASVTSNINFRMLAQSSGLDAMKLLVEHTDFPYYASVMPEPVKQATLAARLEQKQGTAVQLNAPGLRWLHSSRSLRFCPECLPRMISEYGETYWRRDHQIPSILLCPEHECVLRHADRSSVGMQQLCPATAATCPLHAPHVACDLTPAEIETLLEIARRSAGLLSEGASIVSRMTDADQYYALLRVKGLAAGCRRNKAGNLRTEMERHFGHLRRIWPGLFLDIAPGGRAALDRYMNSRKAITDPLLDIMTEIVMERLPDTHTPFGKGPWPCPNPLVQHDSALPVTEVVHSVRRGRVYGRFACACGYLYVRAEWADKRMSEPTIRHFGATLQPLLLKAKAEGWSLKRTATIAEVARSTLLAEARMMGLGDIWPSRAEKRLLCR